jgi:hypothetical protein
MVYLDIKNICKTSLEVHFTPKPNMYYMAFAGSWFDINKREMASGETSPLKIEGLMPGMTYLVWLTEADGKSLNDTDRIEITMPK